MVFFTLFFPEVLQLQGKIEGRELLTSSQRQDQKYYPVLHHQLGAVENHLSEKPISR